MKKSIKLGFRILFQKNWTMMFTYVFILFQMGRAPANPDDERPWTKQKEVLFDSLIRNRPKLWDKKYEKTKVRADEYKALADAMNRSGW